LISTTICSSKPIEHSYKVVSETWTQQEEMMMRNFQAAAIHDLLDRNLPSGQIAPQSAAALDQKVVLEVQTNKRQTVAEINPGIYFIDLKVAGASEVALKPSVGRR
jgi:hypothetical protein